MKNKFIIPLLTLCVFVNMVHKLYAQKATLIQLHTNKNTYPMMSYNPDLQNMFFENSTAKFQAEERERYWVGDYSDSNISFRLILERDMGENIKEEDYLHVVAYRCDTVYVGPSSSSAYFDKSSLIVSVVNQKFMVSVLPDKKTLRVTDVSVAGKHLPADLTLFDHKIPEDRFPLLSGGSQSLSSFEHQHKLIYIHIWGSPDNVDNSVDNIDTLKSVYESYKNSAIFVSLFHYFSFEHKPTRADTLAVRKIVSNKKLEWTQGYCDDKLAAKFFVNGINYGLLYDEEGNVVKMFLMPKDLRAYLRKKIGQ